MTPALFIYLCIFRDASTVCTPTANPSKNVRTLNLSKLDITWKKRKTKVGLRYKIESRSVGHGGMTVEY